MLRNILLVFILTRVFVLVWFSCKATCIPRVWIKLWWFIMCTWKYHSIWIAQVTNVKLTVLLGVWCWMQSWNVIQKALFGVYSGGEALHFSFHYSCVTKMVYSNCLQIQLGTYLCFKTLVAIRNSITRNARTWNTIEHLLLTLLSVGNTSTVIANHPVRSGTSPRKS